MNPEYLKKSFCSKQASDFLKFASRCLDEVADEQVLTFASSVSSSPDDSSYHADLSKILAMSYSSFFPLWFPLTVEIGLFFSKEIDCIIKKKKQEIKKKQQQQ